jgi:raffinose/stachyose/melibiose transport system permease protein
MKTTAPEADTRRASRQPKPLKLDIMMVQFVLIANSIVMLYPMLIMVFAVFKDTSEIYQDPFGLPEAFYLGNIEAIFSRTNFVQYFTNSILVTGAAILVALGASVCAAYALARYKFFGNGFIYMFFLAGLMLPLKLAIIPLFVQLNSLGLSDTHFGLILVYVAMSLPSSVFILTGFIRSLPKELEESARIDGASEGRIMWSIMLPLIRPGLVIAGIYNAVPIWNDFFFPLVFIQTDGLKTLPQALTVFIGEYATEWSILFTGLVLGALPIVLIYIVLSRQFIAGMTQGALK